MNILLSSVGRRPYLVRWFQEALHANGLQGSVIAADLDPFAPSQAFADHFVIAPRVDEPSYIGWLSNTLKRYDIEIAVSINDFELSEWARLPQVKFWSPLIRLSPGIQNLVEDKFEMGDALAQGGVRTPRTWLADNLPNSMNPDLSYVTKGRFGSASRGLQFTDADGLEAAIDLATHEVTTRQGIAALKQDKVDPRSLVIVQERISGLEYGVDVVCDLAGSYVAALARRKISMRAGETDRAETVRPDSFVAQAEKVASLVPHPGLIDLDFMIDAEGNSFVIDVNPRFGGGYPFSHLAGAHVPSAYVAWAAGLPVNPDWLSSLPGTVGSKYVEAVKVS
ncbi:ATP-grasp domain-containing protein [Corynebacterium sp. S7]